MTNAEYCRTKKMTIDEKLEISLKMIKHLNGKIRTLENLLEKSRKAEKYAYGKWVEACTVIDDISKMIS